MHNIVVIAIAVNYDSVEGGRNRSWQMGSENRYSEIGRGWGRQEEEKMAIVIMINTNDNKNCPTRNNIDNNNYNIVVYNSAVNNKAIDYTIY